MAATVSQFSLSFLLRDICIVSALFCCQAQQLFCDKFTAYMRQVKEEQENQIDELASSR